ncbi:ABC transporter ATP-binding protein [Bacterioplanes sanyensis]|uniref:ABC transporter ATP-binding protein n=1 Tax=Bacterioplanes sanyensis TaxID=1249553 RepID=A0A222FGG9_9GAMM|nr:ABC transporter ATP-binding protein [Bacterioplanes sanyensis]ASP37511.1 ABC transporter ATP-binding protein [Bacterioplanes sanyensis]
MFQIADLHKGFRLYQKPSDRLKEILLRRPYHRRYEALQGISFALPKGQTLGIIGQNGAGKSTLLKILSGVLLPDSGQVHMQGRVTGLLELGTGFDGALSGRANILNNGLLIGMSADEIRRQEAEIIEFAELGRFIDEPLRTYSSGMMMRLGFAIAIHANPACFLVDEALSVGDGHFQQKCMKRIREFRDQGGSIIFVSHDLNAIKQICDRALVLDDGHIVFDGDTEGAVNTYNRIMARLDGDAEDLAEQGQRHEFGTREAEILDACILGESGPAKSLATGEQARIQVTLKGHEPTQALSLGFMIRDRFGQDIYGTNSHYLKHEFELLPGQQRKLEFALPMNLAVGKYTVTLALHSEQHHLEHCYHWIDNYIGFEIAGSRVPPFAGVVALTTKLHTIDSTSEEADA